MKIGIMSMQRVCNYGSFLQAYGLKKLIESFGHEVVFIDYKPGKTITYKNNKYTYYKSLIRNSIMEIAAKMVGLLFFATEEQKYSLTFKKKYNTEYLPLLGITRKKKYNSEVDVLVIGSDEVFNCLQTNPEVGFSKELFGYNNNAEKVITYAASFGNTTIEGLEKYQKKAIVASLLKKIDAFSVRDRNSYEIVKTLTHILPNENLDPVLMYDFSREVKDVVLKEKYIVVYAYRNRITPEEKKAIRSFAKKFDLKIYAIGGYQDFCDKNIQGTPFEILGFIKSAEYVITDTFHGTIFSVINNRQFVTFIRQGHCLAYGNFEKLMDLLERLKLTERVLLTPDNLERVLLKSINYTETKQIIQVEREKTVSYLALNLK